MSDEHPVSSIDGLLKGRRFPFLTKTYSVVEEDTKIKEDEKRRTFDLVPCRSIPGPWFTSDGGQKHLFYNNSMSVRVIKETTDTDKSVMFLSQTINVDFDIPGVLSFIHYRQKGSFFNGWELDLISSV